ncbi:MAG: hypothetical protein ACT4N2_05295 [Hyphomicrobium sp.]
MIDTLALLAIAAFGWGLSLATYRFFAQQYGWPMGVMQADLPQVPAILGIVALLVGLLFAAMRGTADGGAVIVVFGLMLAMFWTGFLRVGAQTSLLLAPVAAILLLLGFFSGSSYDRASLRPYGVDVGVPSGTQPADRDSRRTRD